MTSYSSRRELTQSLIEAGRRLDDLGLVPARDGNLSARLGRDRLLITASGVRKRSLGPGDLIEVDLGGQVRGPGRVSTELGMHLSVYRMREDVGAIVHAHPPVAVGFACAGMGLVECLVPEVVVHLGAVPLTPYATPGTPELEEAIRDIVHDHDAFLLANHGAVTMGADVDQALDRMETVEQFARIALVANVLGGTKPLPRGEVATLEGIRRSLGNPRPATCRPRQEMGRAEEHRDDEPAPDLAAMVAEAVQAILGRGPTPRG